MKKYVLARHGAIVTAAMTRDELRTRAERIRARIAKTVEDIIDAGRELLAVKSSISRDQFIKWVEA